MSDLFQRLKSSFNDEKYRHVYADAFVDSKIATQIKVLREQPGREWTQEQLAQRAAMRQARISALEDVNYSAWTLSTLRRLARAYDLYIDVEFKEFGRLETDLDGLDREHLSRCSFRDDPAFIEETGEPETIEEREKVAGQTPIGRGNLVSIDELRKALITRGQPDVSGSVPRQPQGGLAYAACSSIAG